MKKRILSMMLAVILVLAVVNVDTVTAQAAGKTKVYQANAVRISELKKSGGKLKIKADEWKTISVKDQKKWILTAQKALLGNTKVSGKKTRTLKIAKNCKWSRCDTGNNSGKYSYSTLKKWVKEARKFYLKAEYDASYGVVQIFVKNNKIVRVNIFTS